MDAADLAPFSIRRDADAPGEGCCMMTKWLEGCEKEEEQHAGNELTAHRPCSAGSLWIKWWHGFHQRVVK
jgi:hypothetical protein